VCRNRPQHQKRQNRALGGTGYADGDSHFMILALTTDTKGGFKI
jgi:hypothetical protein